MIKLTVSWMILDSLLL